MAREQSSHLVRMRTLNKVEGESCLSGNKRQKCTAGDEENRRCNEQIPCAESQKDSEDEFEIAWRYAEQQAALRQQKKLDSSKILNLLIGDRTVKL